MAFDRFKRCESIVSWFTSLEINAAFASLNNSDVWRNDPSISVLLVESFKLFKNFSASFVTTSPSTIALFNCSLERFDSNPSSLLVVSFVLLSVLSVVSLLETSLSDLLEASVLSIPDVTAFSSFVISFVLGIFSLFPNSTFSSFCFVTFVGKSPFDGCSSSTPLSWAITPDSTTSLACTTGTFIVPPKKNWPIITEATPTLNFRIENFCRFSNFILIPHFL